MSRLGELILGLMVAVSVLSVLARVIGVPYPILLVIGGLGIGFVPGLPEVELEPDLVLVLVLPPLLYAAAFFSSLRDLRANLRPISTLAVGLVVVTACVVAVVAHTLIDGLPWEAAFVLGAVVAPTDPLAATQIASRLGAPRRIVTIVEGESLINDGTALTAYRVAVAATVGGAFSLWEASGEFLVDTIGGVGVGFGVGFLIGEARRRIHDTPVEITIALGTGYAAYLPAESIGLSGVLAAVTAALYMAWLAPDISSSEMRMQGTAVWDTLVFLLNAVLFMLVGLQLPIVLEGLQDRDTIDLLAWAAAICVTIVGIRVLWLYVTSLPIRVSARAEGRAARKIDRRERLVVGWAGMRGAVSLAAALAIPTEVSSGAPFPARDLIIFLAFAAIVFSLVVQGLTLPALIRRLRIEGDEDEDEREEVVARLAATDAALARLDELAAEDWTQQDTVDRVRRQYDYRRRRFSARQDGDDGSDGIEERSRAYQELTRELLAAQQRALVRLRKDGEIHDEVMRRVQRDFDLEDSRLEI